MLLIASRSRSRSRSRLHERRIQRPYVRLNLQCSTSDVLRGSELANRLGTAMRTVHNGEGRNFLEMGKGSRVNAATASVKPDMDNTVLLSYFKAYLTYSSSSSLKHTPHNWLIHITMVPDTAAKSSRPGLSLYANLLDPSSKQDSAPGSISRAPVVFKQAAGDEAQQDRAAAEKQQISAGRYQPTSV